MTKRRLNQQQLRRIDRQQQRSVHAAGQTPAHGDASTGNEPDGWQGLIVCHYGQQLDVEALDGPQQGQRLRCHQRSNLPALVTGDRVIWQADGEQRGVIVAQLPRQTQMSRPNPRGELRAIAANVDRVVVVLAPVPEPFGNLIDRYLVAIEHLGLQALILLNKADLLSEARQADEVTALLALYASIGYPTLTVSSHQGEGMDALKTALQGYTAVFVGQSGVGKSSLINTLRGPLAEESADVGALSVGHEKGTHTTTATRLYHLPGSGDLIDSPGIREFGLWHIEVTALAQGFREFRPLLGQCRFRDCQHSQEPGCALRAAVAAGEITQARLNSFHQIVQSLATAR